MFTNALNDMETCIFLICNNPKILLPVLLLPMLTFLILYYYLYIPVQNIVPECLQVFVIARTLNPISLYDSPISVIFAVVSSLLS